MQEVLEEGSFRMHWRAWGWGSAWGWGTRRGQLSRCDVMARKRLHVQGGTVHLFQKTPKTLTRLVTELTCVRKDAMV